MPLFLSYNCWVLQGFVNKNYDRVQLKIKKAKLFKLKTKKFAKQCLQLCPNSNVRNFMSHYTSKKC